MHENEIRKQLTDNPTVIQFPANYKYKNYNVEGIVKLPIVEKSCYDTWAANNHHFKPAYHLEYTLPTLENLIHFNYSPDDFTKAERQSEGYDTSYLVPKQDNLSFNVDWYNYDKHSENVPYSFIANCTEPEYWECKPMTDYHRMYAYPHSCSHIVNNTITSTNRTLFISGDSQMIPVIPILCCYFREIYYFDNRNNKSYIKNVDITKVTDKLFCLGFDNQSKYYTNNLR